MSCFRWRCVHAPVRGPLYLPSESAPTFSRTLFWKLVIHLYQFLSFCWIILISTQRHYRIFHLTKVLFTFGPISGVSFRKLTERVVYICFSYFTSHFLNTLKLPKTAFDQVITGLYLAKLMVAALSTFFAISSSSLLAKDSYFYLWLWLQVWIFN